MKRLAHRYASALFKLSQEHNVVDAVRQDLSHLIDVIQSEKIIQNFFVNPLTTFDNLNEICLRLGELLKLDPLTARLLTILNRHKRMGLLTYLNDEFNQLNDNSQHKIQGEITTVVPLTQTMQKRLQKIYQTALGQSITFTTRIDPKLIGGMLVKAGPLMIDTSLRTRLNKIKNTLKR